MSLRGATTEWPRAGPSLPLPAQKLTKASER